MPYAADTTVPVDRSRAEMEKLLRRHGCTAFAYAVQPDRARVEFIMGGRHVRLELPTPKPADFPRLTRARAEAAAEKSTRARWRALVLIVKAKLTAVEAGITTIDGEFLADVVMPNNTRVADWLGPQLDAALAAGRMPELMP